MPDLGRAVGVGERGRLVGCGGMLVTAWASRRVWLVGVEHSPDDLATAIRRKDSESARESGDEAEPSPVNIDKPGVPLTRQVRAPVSNSEA